MAEPGKGVDVEKVVRLFAVIGVGAAIVIGSIISSMSGGSELEIVVSAVADANSGPMVLRGRVLADGDPVPEATVWAVASDERGNRSAPPSTETDATGGFTIDCEVRKAEVTDLLVSAKKTRTVDGKETTLRGREALSLKETGRIRWVRMEPGPLSLVFGCFLLSIFLGLLPWKKALLPTYYTCIVLAIALTALMVVYIAIGLHQVSASGTSKDEVMSFGFANIYYSSYVPGIRKEWVFSLTAPVEPPPVASGQEPDGLDPGFGAPLWVILVSVVGAGLFTISLILNDINRPPTEDDVLRARKEAIVRHQFYILFSPLGSVLVYQILVLLGAASQHVTVVLTSLAAGLALNMILDLALSKVQAALGKAEKALLGGGGPPRVDGQGDGASGP